jgi:hypothetical protein
MISMAGQAGQAGQGYLMTFYKNRKNTHASNKEGIRGKKTACKESF